MKLPQNKGDDETAAALIDVPVAALRPYIPELLEWLQDCNWPVSRPVARVLERCGLDLVEPVRQAFRSNDAIWKYWIVQVLLPEVGPAVRSALRPELLRMLHQPTLAEADEDVPNVVQALLDSDHSAEP